MIPNTLLAPAKKVEALLNKKKVRLTQGGEPTLVPISPEGPEWSITAVGPTKLRYAYEFANEMVRTVAPGSVVFYSPGKSYPGETNPRWVLNMLTLKSGKPLLDLAFSSEPVTQAGYKRFREQLLIQLKLKASWIKGLPAESSVWILPLDHDKKFVSADWKKKSMTLLQLDAPAGLRLPLNEVPADLSRRALTVELQDNALAIFFPPLLQKPFLELLKIIQDILASLKISNVRFQGYVPSDDADIWSKLGVASDPGVLEINIPPCETWTEYAKWMTAIENCGNATGLRAMKVSGEVEIGTGGGNHICFGGPSVEQNAFFKNPGWVTSILRFWQHHPSLSYLFTGAYVGSSSQAPRTDESARSLYDLEMAYQYLESLKRGDHRQIINETLRHLHIDGSGNTHRSEISFDKFWNVSFPGGAHGILEFRAIETLPSAEWTSAVALLWRALAAALLTKPFHQPLKDLNAHLQDRFFLPSFLWDDLMEVLAFLAKQGIHLPVETFRAIWEWRFPVLLETQLGSANITIRKALESWPLLCEQPLEGGSTSRFVDTSIERLEITTTAPVGIQFQGRKLPLETFPSNLHGAGLRFRKTALYPSLHPGIPPQLPLEVTFSKGSRKLSYQLQAGQFKFAGPFPKAISKPGPECRRSAPNNLTYDLRLP
ncbi:MAG: transglutaminase family protein [Chthoniobacterales bacterium]